MITRVFFCFLSFGWAISSSAPEEAQQSPTAHVLRPSLEDSHHLGFPSPKPKKSILYTLDNEGIFHRCSPIDTPQSGKLVYSVLKNGILVPRRGQYGVEYNVNERGDLVPTENNTCIYKSDKPAFYIRTKDRKLIPVDIYYSGDEIHYVFGGNRLLLTEKVDKSVKHSFLLDREDSSSVPIKALKPSLVPDKSCNGDVILFHLKSNGVFTRNPPDEYIPKGIKLRYHLQDNGSLSPLFSRTGLPLTYITETDGNLKPCSTNTHTFTTLKETTKSFLLGEGGTLAPVSEIIGENKTINYFSDGQLVHSSNQFNKVFSNSSMLVLSEKEANNDTEIQADTPGPKFFCPLKRISKRDTRGIESRESDEKQHKKPAFNPHCKFAYDDQGKRILLEPLVNECGKIALYKLTCKGHLKRLAPYKEPEHGFEVRFKLLDNFALIPVSKDNCKIFLKYTLMENGNLVPCPRQANSLKKAPASMVYYVLAKNKELLPVRLSILKSNHIQVFFQDCLIHTIPPCFSKDLEVFTTIYAPFYAYVNARIVVGYKEERRKPHSGSTWSNPKKCEENSDVPLKNLYLSGPNHKKIIIKPSINKNGVPCIYEMDCNGVCHKSPKDDNKNMVLKSYRVLKEGILIPSNDTNCYIYLIDKLGNMLPYCFPETKLRAPFGLTVKYVLCEEGVLLPVLVEAFDLHIQFSFEGTVIYKKRTYTIDEVVELEEDKRHMPTPEPKVLKDEDEEEDIFFKDKDGNCAYYEKIGNNLRRRPSQKVEEYLCHSMGYFKILHCGILKQVDFPDPTCDNLHVMIESNGDLQILPNNARKLDYDHYLMSTTGDLIPVEVKKRDGYIKFYRKGIRVFKQYTDKWKMEEEKIATPSGKDPLGILKDSEPKKCEEKEPHYVSIPINTVKVHGKNKCGPKDYEKCEHIRKTIESIMSKEPSAMNLELEMTDGVMGQIYDLASRCSKLQNCDRHPRSIRRDQETSVEDNC